MTEAIFAQIKKQREFLLYSVIGVSGATLDYLLFLLFHYWFGLDKFLANSLSVSVGISNNFLWNAFFNFKTRDGLVRRFLMFFAVGLFGMALSSLILKVGVDWLHLHVGAVKFGSIFVVVLVQFNLNRLFAFAKSRTA